MKETPQDDDEKREDIDRKSRTRRNGGNKMTFEDNSQKGQKKALNYAYNAQLSWVTVKWAANIY
jgi:hypothetical protein